MARAEITKPTLKKLFALCAFPGCDQAVVNEHGDLIAEVCHIEAANEEGQRYNPDQSDDDRRSSDNLLILCPNHHKVTDNVAEYPVKRLRDIKQDHESQYAARPPAIDDSLHPRLYEQAARQLSGPTRPMNLPYHSLGPLFKGRDEFFERLRESLCDAPVGHATAIAGKAVHGLGGVGKTRLAVEYAWHHVDEYTALLFVVADSPESLARNLAELCGPAMLDLPEQQLPQEEPRRLAVLRWLREHPGWLLILDNVDTREAADAAEGLLNQLHGGQVLLTGRLSTWSPRVQPLELDVLSDDDAAEFLLARTDSRRRKADDDAAVARTLADDLGCLALALEQAGAYIGERRLTLAGYREQWHDRHEHVIDWFDERLMQYHHSLATTWQMSVDRLSAPARHLLERLAWFAPDPIPELLLDAYDRVPVVERSDPTDSSGSGGSLRSTPATHPAATPHDCLAELERYSLVTRAGDSPTFTVHRLVQDVTRRSLLRDTEHRALTEALGWINTAFEGDPADVRTWPTLEPLTPHARAAADHADRAGITDPTARLMAQLGVLLDTKALHAEAEPFKRRALAIDEQRFGKEHPNVAIHLNNLATLLQDTNRLDEAEPLMRRALAIFLASLGAEHPSTGTVRVNYVLLLEALGRSKEEIQAELDALRGE